MDKIEIKVLNPEAVASAERMMACATLLSAKIRNFVKDTGLNDLFVSQN